MCVTFYEKSKHRLKLLFSIFYFFIFPVYFFITYIFITYNDRIIYLLFNCKFDYTILASHVLYFHYLFIVLPILILTSLMQLIDQKHIYLSIKSLWIYTAINNNN